MKNRVSNAIVASIETKKRFLEDKNNIQLLIEIADTCISAFNNDKKVLFCGNGGSAADAQHLAAELSGRFGFDRDPLYAEALHVNTSFLTAVANDYGYEDIYSRMIKGSGRSGDVLIGLSTSGNSENVYRGMLQAKSQDMICIGFTGEQESKISQIADLCVRAPSMDTPRIQELHITTGHIICDLIEQSLFAEFTTK